MARRHKLELRYTDKAMADIRSIAQFTQENWGVEQRRVYLAQINDKVNMLTTTPHIGVALPGDEQRYRTLRVGSHRVLFRHIDNRLEILRVLHSNMDIERALKRERRKERGLER